MAEINPLAAMQSFDYTNNLLNETADARARRAAGSAIAAGNLDEAAGVLGGRGMLSDQLALQGAQRTQETAEQTRVQGFLRDATEALLAAPEAERDAVYQQLRPFLANVYDEDMLARLDSVPRTDANLRSFYTALGGEAPAANRRYVNVGPELVEVDENTGATRSVYQSPYPVERDGLLYGGQGGATQQPTVSSTLPWTPSPRNPSQPASGQPSAGSVPLETMVGITAQAESGNRSYNRDGTLVTSPAGAQGRMQVMPGTNRDPGFGVRPARDGSEAERIRVGRDYLAAMMRRYNNDPARAWAAYNWGPGNLDSAIQRHGDNWLQNAPAETRNYVQRNLAALGR